ncbi:MAG: glycosyltransferase [Candidatus Bathyarchaeota archaeon]|nr:glycosyltransferase [Candidatus Bathyarchaeota archaeon]
MKGTYVNSDVGIILPTYCEAVNIEKSIDEIESLRLNACILVVDDSSPDGTSNVVRMLQKRYENILLLVRPKKLGLGKWVLHNAVFIRISSVVKVNNG